MVLNEHLPDKHAHGYDRLELPPQEFLLLVVKRDARESGGL
jgi:hypothetical protein